MHTHEPFSRRKLLALGAAAGAGLAVGAAPGSPASAHGNMQPYSTIYFQPTYYEDLNTGQAMPRTFNYDPTFHSQLDTWLQNWYTNTPSNWITPIQVWRQLAGFLFDLVGAGHRRRALLRLGLDFSLAPRHRGDVVPLILLVEIEVIAAG